MTTLLSRPSRASVAIGSTAIALALVLSGCGGADPAADSSAPGSSTSTGSKSGDSVGDGVELPASFPDDIPLPEDAKLHSSAVIGDDNGWRFMYVVDPDDDGRYDRYAARLVDAGFEVDPTEGNGVNLTASRDNWRLDAVVRPPTITVQVLSVG